MNTADCGQIETLLIYAIPPMNTADCGQIETLLIYAI